MTSSKPLEPLPEEVSKGLIVVRDIFDNIVAYGRPKHIPMQGWGDYIVLTDTEIENLRKKT